MSPGGLRAALSRLTKRQEASTSRVAALTSSFLETVHFGALFDTDFGYPLCYRSTGVVEVSLGVVWRHVDSRRPRINGGQLNIWSLTGHWEAF